MRALRLFLALPAVLLAATTLAANPSLPSNRPNVVFVITDDQGYGDLSCHGNPILQTPELDKLHAESLRLTDYHVSPTCAPTRGALMSGQYSNRAGTWHTINARSLIFKESLTLGEVFQSAGYETGMFGKWHLGDNYPYRPEDRGFSEVVRHGAGGEGQMPDYWDNAYFDSTYFHNSEPKKFTGYCTDIFFSEAERFMGESFAKGKPFFAYISTNAPHSPFHCPEKYWKPYLQKGLTKEEAIFFGMIANIDENVGKLRTWLADNGIERNTLFIFTTDNGTATGQNVFNSGMRGRKSEPYEGGHRVPFFLYWPDGKLTGGKDVDQLTAHLDILPTLAGLCGLELPAAYHLDGRSLVPLLHSLPTSWPDRTLITDSQRVLHPIKWRRSAVMNGPWRLINGEELYDLSQDPGQGTNIATAQPQIVAQLRREYEDWWQGLRADMEKTARISLGNEKANPVLLTSHDWYLEGEVVPWNQEHTRQGNNLSISTGRWAVEVEQSSAYRVSLYRWPPSLDLALDAPLEAGFAVPGLSAFREAPGKAIPIIGATLRARDQVLSAKAVARRSSIEFELYLDKGTQNLDASFTTQSGETIGAFYCLVEKL